MGTAGTEAERVPWMNVTRSEFMKELYTKERNEYIRARNERLYGDPNYNSEDDSEWESRPNTGEVRSRRSSGSQRMRFEDTGLLGPDRPPSSYSVKSGSQRAKTPLLPPEDPENRPPTGANGGYDVDNIRHLSEQKQAHRDSTYLAPDLDEKRLRNGVPAPDPPKPRNRSVIPPPSRDVRGRPVPRPNSRQEKYMASCITPPIKPLEKARTPLAGRGDGAVDNLRATHNMNVQTDSIITFPRTDLRNQLMESNVNLKKTHGEITNGQRLPPAQPFGYTRGRPRTNLGRVRPPQIEMTQKELTMLRTQAKQSAEDYYKAMVSGDKRGIGKYLSSVGWNGSYKFGYCDQQWKTTYDDLKDAAELQKEIGLGVDRRHFLKSMFL